MTDKTPEEKPEIPTRKDPGTTDPEKAPNYEPKKDNPINPKEDSKIK